MPRSNAPASVADVVFVIVVCFGWFIVGSIGAVASGFPTKQFDDSSFFAIILTELILATVALTFLYYRGHSLTPLIPAPTAVGCLIGLALYTASLVATWPISWVVGSHELAAQPIEQMVRGAAITLPALMGVSVVNGMYEETFLTGYLLPALEPFGASFAIGASLLVRVLYHLYQGPLGAVGVLVVGAIFSVYFWRTRKLWPVVFAHIFADLAGFALT